jgi:hypothetical protein
MSALPPIADIRQRIEHVCFVPEADICSSGIGRLFGKNGLPVVLHVHDDPAALWGILTGFHQLSTAFGVVVVCVALLEGRTNEALPLLTQGLEAYRPPARVSLYPTTSASSVTRTLKPADLTRPGTCSMRVWALPKGATSSARRPSCTASKANLRYGPGHKMGRPKNTSVERSERRGTS